MKFDEAGHLRVTPAEIDALMRSNIPKLINDVLLPGVPVLFATYDEYRSFLNGVAKSLAMHPASLFAEARKLVLASLLALKKYGWN